MEQSTINSELLFPRTGDFLAIGAEYSDPDGQTDAGAAYLFDLSTLPRSLPGDRDGDGFSDALEANATTNRFKPEFPKP